MSNLANERHTALITLEEHFIITPVGLLIAGAPDFASWQRVGASLRAVSPALRWAIGDWILAGEARYGQMYSQALDQTEYEMQSLADMVWVCRAWPFEQRYGPPATFEHHRVLAPLPAAQREFWMEIALERRMSASKLREAKDRFMRGEPLEVVLEDVLNEPLIITPEELPKRPRLICNTAAQVLSMDDQTITLHIERLPRSRLATGVPVYVQIAVMPDEVAAGNNTG